MNAILDEQYRRAVRSETPPQILCSLASSPFEKIRAAVAENPGTPVESLSLLARDHCPEVRSCVAQNTSTPWSIALALAMDTNLDVRYSLAENPELAWTILCFLSFDQNPYVSFRAKKTMSAISPQIEKNNRKLNAFSSEEMEAASPENIYKTLCAMFKESGRLSKIDALKLKDLILLDGQVSKAEQKIMEIALTNQLLDDDASKIFSELLA